MSGLYGNAIMAPAALKTIILEDEDGNEMATGVVVGEETVFTATDNDVRLGKIYAGDEGVRTGTKDIPSYHTTTGVQFIEANAEFKIIIDEGTLYDYTELQAMTMPYNSSTEDSNAVDRVVIKDKVYNVNSNTAISNVTKNSENKSILFGITNGSNPAVIKFFMYKED